MDRDFERFAGVNPQFASKQVRCCGYYVTRGINGRGDNGVVEDERNCCEPHAPDGALSLSVDALGLAVRASRAVGYGPVSVMLPLLSSTAIH